MVKLSTFKKRVRELSKQVDIANKELEARSKYDHLIKHWPFKELLKEIWLRIKNKFN